MFDHKWWVNFAVRDSSLFVSHSQSHKSTNCEIKSKNIMIIKRKEKKKMCENVIFVGEIKMVLLFNN